VCPQFWLDAKPPARTEVPCPDCVVDPINPGIGNVFQTEDDIRAGAIVFRRFYNSEDAAGGTGGTGWRHSYGRYVSSVYQIASLSYPGQGTTITAQYATPSDACAQGFSTIRTSVSTWQNALATYNNGVCVLSTPSGVVVGTVPIQAYPPAAKPQSPLEYDAVRDDGQVLRYTPQNGTLNSQPGNRVRLISTASGFSVTDEEDNVEAYNAQGVLQSITTRAGVVQTLSYGTNGQLTGIADTFGNTLSLGYDTQGYLATTTLNGGTPVQYAYDVAGRLTTVTYPDSTTRKYTYGLNGRLASIVDENGATFSTWSYNSQNQVSETHEAGGANAALLVYNPDNSVTVTDALGAVRTFAYGRVGDINRPTSISGSQCPTCQEMAATTYDAAGYVSSRTDYNGNLIAFHPENGEILWHFPMLHNLGNGPSTYMLDNSQYLIVGGGDTLFAFALPR